ncbi:nucleoid-associated protein [Aerococcus tenax]|uniref:nucleoid-associated protein n=1 Tax=Aerococcus tenax TaxID=3078812 RepID=UPI0018A7395B|nr:nucleoid-associated protein [Aerococcus tenax]
MIIKEAILHIYDQNINQGVMSELPLAVDSNHLFKYMNALIDKVWVTDKKKRGTFPADNEKYQQFQAAAADFIPNSQALASQWFQFIQLNPDIPAADLLWLRFSDDQGEDYLAAFKLNHNESYTHNLVYNEDNVQNDLIIHKNILPSAKQAIDEGIVVNLASGQYDLVEKKHEIESLGEKVNYFSELYLKVPTKPSAKESIQAIKKAVEKTAHTYDEQVYQSLAKAKDILYHEMSGEEGFSNERIADYLYEDNLAKKQSYLEETQTFPFDNEMMQEVESIPTKLQRQKLKLDNGIEITIPLDLFYDPDVIELSNNPDGTISVTIKNIESIKNMF